ncbi:hypothetical protein R5R35_010841 [Gryllus longicercus]|uniref:Uncharacterized protein n=1 Tax=Gryllus longicercus TaxID=2509291 RepID=A0AAN9W0Q0_9ORTH
MEHDYTVMSAHECHGKEGLPTRWLNVSLQRVSVDEVAISAIFELQAKLFNQDENDPSKTDQVIEYAMTQVCKKMKDRDSDVMNAFVDSVKGLSGCPIEAGEYLIENFKVMIKDLKPFLSEGLMILELDMVIDGNTVSCTSIDMKITPAED